MKKYIEKTPLVPHFVDMGESILLAVSHEGVGIQRFIKDETGRLVAPVGVYGLSYFSIEEIALKIRFLLNSDDPWLKKTGEFLQTALDSRSRLCELYRKNRELVFCLVYRKAPDEESTCGFALIPVTDNNHLALLETDAIAHGDSYYCYLRKINDPSSFSMIDKRLYLICNADGKYLRCFKDGTAKWTNRRNKGIRLSKSRGKVWVKNLKKRYPGVSFRMTQYVSESKLYSHDPKDEK